MYNIDGLLPPPLFFMSSFSISIKRSHPFLTNKLAKARMTRKSPGTLGLNKFGPGKLWFEKVWAQNIFMDVLAELDHSKKTNFQFFFNHDSAAIACFLKVCFQDVYTL